MTGRGPLVVSSCHPDTKRSAAAPDDLFSILTVAQPPFWASELSLKSLASCVSSSNFSGELATSTVVQPLPPVWPPPFEDEQATRAPSATTRATTVIRLNGPRPATPSAAHRGSRPTAAPTAGVRHAPSRPWRARRDPVHRGAGPSADLDR